MADDSFETVAIVYNQPETAVMLSMFAFYGIPAIPIGLAHSQIAPNLMVALGGVLIRVPDYAANEARELLAEVAERPQAVRPRLIDNAILNGVAVVLFCMIGGPVPPTRTGSTFFLGKD
ncbi:MAG: hypothetical protein P0Y59_19545 [Candidatus Sphingomonas phytovorans]|nr:hypothetical protein [Sphingomonas sp.]WEJ99115.1 MAG: hypothetical protein P0Y59_19545 [Sphingomonas sp.]